MSMGLSMLATVLSILLAAGVLDAAPYQELQPRAGYVPVYIREGETPLSEIHPRLAEAFKEEQADSPQQEMIFEKPNANTGIAKESSVNVAEAAKEAIKELVNVFDTEMLDKLGLSKDDGQSNSKDKNEQKPNKDAKTENDDSASVEKEDKSPEKPSDVLTVEAFKAKDFNNKDSGSDEGIDVPEDVPYSDQ